MKYIDISVALHPDMPVWTDSHGVNTSRFMSFEKGDGVTVSRLDIDVHSGTHIDAPLHFVENGKTTNEIPLEKLLGTCYVVDMRGKEKITAKDLEEANIPKDVKKLLFKTDNSKLWENPFHSFYLDYCALTADAAQWVVDRGIHLTGIDYLSIQLYYDAVDTHVILLENEVVILETLNLTEVEPGYYELICLPLKVHNMEGISVRAVLRLHR